MPIGGFVINVDPENPAPAIEVLSGMKCVDIHGHDEKGNVVAVLDCDTSDEMESLVEKINGIDGVFSVGLTYFNAEDEIDNMEKGKYIPLRSFGNKIFRKD